MFNAYYNRQIIIFPQDPKAQLMKIIGTTQVNG
jgi:hypothetical protein